MSGPSMGTRPVLSAKMSTGLQPRWLLTSDTYVHAGGVEETVFTATAYVAIDGSLPPASICLRDKPLPFGDDI